MTQPSLPAQNLLAQHLWTEWQNDPGKTLSWWSARWRVPLPLVEKWVKGLRRVGPAYAAVFHDLPFTPEQYFESDWGLLFAGDDVPELPREFVVGASGRATQLVAPQMLPVRRSVDASAAFGRLRAAKAPAEAAGDDETIDEIRTAVLERGHLTKQEIVETWGLTEDEYREIHTALARDRRIDSGPPRSGGLVAKLARTRAEDALGPANIQLEEWARLAAERLEALLSQSELLRLVGDLESGIRNARRIHTGEDRPSRKSELAAALVLQHGIDLFAHTDVRAAVAKAAKVPAPGNWHPGKAGAARFVAEVNFPAEFVGVPSAESRPDMEYLEGRFRLEPLQKFQKEVQRKLLNTLQDPPGRRCIVTLPTGAGKTRVAVEAISYWMYDRYDHATERATRGTVVWLAHTEELCEQACACFRQVWQSSDDVVPVTLTRFWGSYTKDLIERKQALEDAMLRPAVIVSTPHRLASLFDGHARGSDAVLDAIRANLGLIVVDEAHRAGAPMYRKLVTLLSESHRPEISIVGLTATPFRMEYLGDDPERGTKELKEIFHHIVEPNESLGAEPRLALQKMEILAEPIFEAIETKTRMRIPDPPQSDFLSEEEMERIDRVLAIRADNAPRRIEILKRIIAIAADPSASILYFGPSVRDAECMAFLLRERGITAAVVSGATRDAARRRAIDDFKNGAVRVLCNCEVLTTGFDAPRVTHVVIGRPTVSRVLYEQIVGRGLRGPKFGGTPTCVVIDCHDDIRGERPPLGYESFRRVWYSEQLR